MLETTNNAHYYSGIMFFLGNCDLHFMIVSELKIVEGETNLDLSIKGLKHEVFLRNHPSSNIVDYVIRFWNLFPVGCFTRPFC